MGFTETLCRTCLTPLPYELDYCPDKPCAQAGLPYRRNTAPPTLTPDDLADILLGGKAKPNYKPAAKPKGKGKPKPKAGRCAKCHTAIPAVHRLCWDCELGA